MANLPPHVEELDAECGPENPHVECPVAPELVHVAEFAARKAADDAAEKALKKWVLHHAAPIPSMSRAELDEIIRATCKLVINETLKSIGLDMGDPAETATKMKLLFRTQHAAGMVIVWTAAGILAAMFGGVLWLIAWPWRMMHGGGDGMTP